MWENRDAERSKANTVPTSQAVDLKEQAFSFVTTRCSNVNSTDTLECGVKFFPPTRQTAQDARAESSVQARYLSPHPASDSCQWFGSAQWSFGMQSHRRLGPILLLLALLAVACTGGNEGELLASARSYLDKNDPKAAAIQLKNALQQQPDSAEARFLLGRALLESGDAPGAEIELRRSIELGRAPGEVASQLARALLAQRQYDKLIQQFALVEVADPLAAVDLHLALAEAYAASDLPDKARTELATALTRSPQSVPVRIAQARLQASTGEYDSALTTLEQLLVEVADSVDAWQLKGAVLAHGKRDTDGAIAAYQRALALQPSRPEVHAALISLYFAKQDRAAANRQFEAMKAAAPGHPLTGFYEAQILFARAEYVQAQQRLQELLRLVPDNVGVLHLAGATELQLGAWSQAEVHLVKAVQLSPGFVAARRLLAATYLRGNQPARALAVLRPVLDQKTIDIETLTVAGQAALLAGQANEADTLFRRAAAARPNDVKARTALAMSQLSNGRADAAFSELQSIAAADPGTTADMALISARMQRREFSAALKAIDVLDKKAPNNAANAELRGRIYLAQKDVAAARRAFERAIQIDPRYGVAVISLAALDVVENKPDAAKARFDKLLELDPKNVQALLGLAELRRRAGGSREEVAALINSAIGVSPTDPLPRSLLVDHYLAGGETGLALSAAQAAVSAMPGDPLMQEKLARALMQSGDINQAGSLFGKLAVQHPESVLGHQGLAETSLAKRDFAAAWKSAARVLELTPNSIAAQRVAIFAAMGLKRPRDALMVARSMQTQRPAEALGYILEGEVQVNQKQLDAAAAAFRKALAVPNPAQAPARLHAVLQLAGKPADAARFAEQWLNSHPKDTLFLLYLADADAKQGHLASAERRYRQLLQLLPDHAVALNNLAGVLIRQNKPGAVALAERAVQMAPNRAPLVDTLALAMAVEGQHAKAIALQKDLVSRSPDVPVYRLTLAKIYLLSGDKVMARSELDSLLKPGKESALRDEATQLLRQLSNS